MGLANCTNELVKILHNVLDSLENFEVIGGENEKEDENESEVKMEKANIFRLAEGGFSELLLSRQD